MWEYTVVLLCLAVALWFRWRKKKFSLFMELGIPGPEPSIIFGNAWEIWKKTPIQCHKEWIQKYGKVLGYYFGGIPMLLVADIELMKKILISDFHKFTNRPQNFAASPQRRRDKFSKPLTVLQDKRWKEIRSIITPSFTASKMKMMLPIMDSAVDSLLDILEKKSQTNESFDMYKLYQGLTMDVIGRTAFGIKTDCQNNPDDIILKASRAIFSGTLNFLTITVLSFPELAEIWKYVNTLRLTLRNQGTNPLTDLKVAVEGVIKERREKKSVGRQDLLQIMMDAAVTESELNKITDEQLTAKGEQENELQENDEMGKDTAKKGTKLLRYMVDSEIVVNSILFFLAGYETTSTALAFTTHFLLHHQDIQQKIREDIQRVIEKEGKLDYSTIHQLQYLDQVFMESVRMYPPIYLFVNREASEDVQYGPYKIKKGLAVQIPVYNIHHDPDLWEDPEKFNPERFSPENKAKQSSLAFQTFGAGPRNCVGMRFAQLEAKLALARILKKYKLLPTEDTDKEKIDLRITVATLTPAKGIHLKVVPVE